MAHHLPHHLQLQLLPDHLRSLSLTDVVRQSLSVAGVYRESIAVLLSAPRTFALITLSLVFPFSLTVLFSYPTPLFLLLTDALLTGTGDGEATHLFNHLLSLLFLFTFSLLSTAAVVFTVASLYAPNPRPVSFTSTLSALPSVLPRLFPPFLATFPLLDAIPILLYFTTNFPSYHPAVLLPTALALLSTLACILFFFALSSLANPASVLEPLHHLRLTIVRSRDLVLRRTSLSATLATAYLTGFHTVVVIFKELVVKGSADGVGIILLGVTLLTLLPVIILHGLIVQTIHYHVCRSSIQMDAFVAGVRVVVLPGDA